MAAQVEENSKVEGKKMRKDKLAAGSIINKGKRNMGIGPKELPTLNTSKTPSD